MLDEKAMGELWKAMGNLYKLMTNLYKLYLLLKHFEMMIYRNYSGRDEQEELKGGEVGIKNRPARRI